MIAADRPMQSVIANRRSLSRTGADRGAANIAHAAFWAWWIGIEDERDHRRTAQHDAAADRLLRSRTPFELLSCRCLPTPIVAPVAVAELELGGPCPTLDCHDRLVLATPCTCSTSPHPPCGSCESGVLACMSCDTEWDTRRETVSATQAGRL